MAQKKIALIGPAPPYRSGIAIHTMELQKALEELTDVQTVSFKRQYPQWLYPGNDKAPDVVRDAAPGVKYIIDVYNPLSWRKATQEIIDGGYDVAILTWWTLFWQPGFTYMLRRLKRHGIKTVYFCHNLFNHKTGGVMGLVDKVLHPASVAMLKQADAYIIQSSEQEKGLLAIKPQATFMRRIHPIAQNPAVSPQHLPKRGRLELLFFGLIRPYKGLDTLLAAAEKLQAKDVYLTVVGEPWGDKEALKQRLAEAKIPNLETRLEYVSDVEAATYFDRADAVVLPYRAATGSAVVALAYAYGKPVIATSVSGLVDAVVEGETGWLVAPESPDALAQAIAGLERADAEATRAGVEAFRKANNWPAMAKAVAEFVGTL